jgi:hypothetical protein
MAYIGGDILNKWTNRPVRLPFRMAIGPRAGKIRHITQ